MFAPDRTTARILDSISDAFFVLSHDWRFAYLNSQAERVLSRPRATLLGRSLWQEFPAAVGSRFEREYRRAVAEQRLISFEAYYPEPLNAWFEIRAIPSADGLSVFFQDVTNRKASEDRQARLSEDNRLLLESTGDGIYGIDLQGRFTFVNRAAARMLGYAPEALLGRNGHQLIHFQRADGAAYPEGECPIYQTIHTGEAVRVEDDVFWRSDGTPFPVDYSAAPILQGDAVRGAVVTFFDISARKTLEHERERLAERERNIAAQLQAALTPTIPEQIPGMALAKYYEAALAEAAVGGDFYDVFPIEKGCTALVVGDLAGKGLAAAAQVATVRNMLRYALYRARTLVGALEGLNALLVEQNLLTGFATLFVGAYESAARTLTYINAGQEPALVRRAATGTIEHLTPSGPVMGVNENAVFEERMVRLAPGDALVLFTDGLTEVGPSRREMLGVEGVAALLSEAPLQKATAAEHAEAITLRLVRGVDDASQGGVARDDMCVLVGVVADRDG